jgi:hypothetical protein
MKRLVFAIIAAAVGLPTACFSPTEPALWPDPLLSGTWATLDYTAAGNADSLYTQARGGQLTGKWREFRSGALHASATVSGSYDSAGAFSLRLKYSTGGAGSYVGNVSGAEYVAGTWTDSTRGFWGNVVFYRNPPPPCSTPLPVRGTYTPPLAPSYFVGFRGTGDAIAEAAFLAERYGISGYQVSTSAPKGLSAQLTSAQLMVLQCEQSVDSIAYAAGISG